MKRAAITLGIVLGALLLAPAIFAQGEKEGQGRAVVTVLPKSTGDSSVDAAPNGLSLKVNGKEATVAKWTPLRGNRGGLELVVLIDGSARSSLGRQLDDITHFVQSLPPDARVAIGYMQNGNAALSGPLTTDRAEALRGLHIPAGSPGSNGSPYFARSDLAKRWPSEDPSARREVLMVTNGVDEYNRRLDLDDPYVQAAVNDSVRARIIIYAIYWRDQGRVDQTQYANNTGQNLIQIVTDATGGKNFWIGNGNPVSFQPYLEELNRRFRNQYELSFITRLNGKPEIQTMKLKLSSPGSEVTAPQQVLVGRATVTQD